MKRTLQHNIELLKELENFIEFLQQSMNGYEWDVILEDYDKMFEQESKYDNLTEAFLAFVEASKPRKKR